MVTFPGITFPEINRIRVRPTVDDIAGKYMVLLISVTKVIITFVIHFSIHRIDNKPAVFGLPLLHESKNF